MSRKSVKQAPDEIYSYFGWKRIIEDNELPEVDEEEKKDETATALSRRLSILPPSSRRESTWSSKTDSDGFDKVNYKMPENKEITIINKWKEVEEADKNLADMREKYKLKMEELDERWRTVEKGQLEIKQKLVEFNNFVREKKVKVEDGKEKTKLEKKAQLKKTDELENLKQEKDLLVKAKDDIESSVAKKKCFEDFLESVVNCVPSEYPDIQVLMMRCSALVATRDKLKMHLQGLNDKIEMENEALEKFKVDKMKQTLEYNVQLVNLQKTASGLQAKTMERKTYMNNLEEKIAEKK